MLLLAAGPLAAGIAALWMRLRRLAAAAPAARGALVRLRRAIADAGDDAAAMAPALYDYLRARLGTNGTPGPEPLAQALEARGVGREQLDELREMLAGLDTARYGGVAAGSAEAFGARILQWAEAVDPILARGGGS